MGPQLIADNENSTEAAMSVFVNVVAMMIPYRMKSAIRMMIGIGNSEKPERRMPTAPVREP